MNHPPLGIISLQYSSAIEPEGNGKIKIVTPDRVWRLDAGNNQEREKWIKGLREAKEIYTLVKNKIDEENVPIYGPNYEAVRDGNRLTACDQTHLTVNIFSVQRKEGILQRYNAIYFWVDNYFTLQDGILFYFASKVTLSWNFSIQKWNFLTTFLLGRQPKRKSTAIRRQVRGVFSNEQILVQNRVERKRQKERNCLSSQKRGRDAVLVHGAVETKAAHWGHDQLYRVLIELCFWDVNRFNVVYFPEFYFGELIRTSILMNILTDSSEPFDVASKDKRSISLYWY